MTKFKPFASAFQSRFKWRHKPSDKWRRLMDSTCFSVDWITRPVGPSMSQFDGFWTHVLTPAHCACPWDYPNYYPPTGDTRFVSKITYADTRTQIRFVSQQGDAAYKYFLSNSHTFVHSNPRLDLAVIHPEQMMKRQGGEMKLMYMQNQGKIMRPMLDIAQPVQKGDIVWIYGLTAEEALFDEEKGEEPKMIPTAIRGIVHATTREQFWVDTMGEEVHMGMCGAPVMRNGKCIGMLTAKVHVLSDCKELAGCAMCTYSRDIFEFLVEVEEQLKNGFERMDDRLTRFERQREAEERRSGQRQPTQSKPFRDWEKDQTRIARRIVVPLSQFRDANDTEYNTAEDLDAAAVYGRHGIVNDEVQENLGFHMNEGRDKTGKPDRIGSPPREHTPGINMAGDSRRDPSPDVTVHGEDIGVVNGRAVKSRPASSEYTADVAEVVDVAMKGEGPQFEMLNQLKHTVTTVNSSQQMEEMRESAFATGGGKYAAKDPSVGEKVFTKNSGGERSGQSVYNAAAEDLDTDSHSNKYRSPPPPPQSEEADNASTSPSLEKDGRSPFDIRVDKKDKDNVYIDGKQIPKAFVEGFRNFGAIHEHANKMKRGEQFRVGNDDGQSNDAASQQQKQEEATKETSSASEIERRMARKAQRAAEKAKKDAAHEAALRARLGVDERVRHERMKEDGGDLEGGLW